MSNPIPAPDEDVARKQKGRAQGVQRSVYCGEIGGSHGWGESQLRNNASTDDAAGQGVSGPSLIHPEILYLAIQHPASSYACAFSALNPIFWHHSR